MNQAAHSVIMIRPLNFGSNPETMDSNAFQKEGSNSSISVDAQTEFDAMVKDLRQADIEVVIFDDRPDPETPDAVFPNNWFSTHEDGTIVTYPMMSESRQKEYREDIIDWLREAFEVKNHISLGISAEQKSCLEGTGSIVFDHSERIAYACESPRTDAKLLNEICKELGYTPFNFQAVDKHGKAIYHTNVMMHIGSRIAVVCLDTIEDTLERAMLTKNLEKGHEILNISFDQMEHFAGNMLEVQDRSGNPVTIMSKTAHDSLTEEQLKILSEKTKVVYSSIPTIEKYGGGSVRCMMAGNHLPKK